MKWQSDSIRTDENADRAAPSPAVSDVAPAGTKSAGAAQPATARVFLIPETEGQSQAPALRWEQYEVWALMSDRWELASAFPEFETARVVASKRGSRVRLVHAHYHGEEVIERQVIMEVGATREQP